MGAGGLNGELRSYSNDIDPQLRCNIQRFTREFAASSTTSTSSPNPSNSGVFHPSSSPARASNPASSSDQENSEQNMTCEDCGANFTIFRRKVMKNNFLFWLTKRRLMIVYDRNAQKLAPTRQINIYCYHNCQTAYTNHYLSNYIWYI